MKQDQKIGCNIIIGIRSCIHKLLQFNDMITSHHLKYRVEKLNVQAHECAISNTDEYVLEAILTFSKFECLLYDLLSIEIWKESVYPLLKEDLAGKNSMRVYFILYHEATLVNLLELFMYHQHMCESAGNLPIIKYIHTYIYIYTKLCLTLHL